MPDGRRYDPMTMEQRYRERYAAGDTPWDIGRPDFNLVESAMRTSSEGPGPPQRKPADIVLAVEPYFEVLSLTSSHFGSNHPHAPRAWRCLMQ